MQKIRIKKTPKPGDQQDYSLVDRNVSFTGQGKADSNVKNTMGATTKDKANIEVEGGETVVGDVNKDGFLEHFSFVGKRHSNGGMPVNIPEGSFIFSDTKKLKIKDKEILESIFGLKEKKGGYTPAEIAKKYQINQFVQDLKSEDTDPIQKRSAAEMLKKNTEKLGMLALVQESMKGFPDGIPAIAESVMAGMNPEQMQGQPEQEGQPMEQPTAEYGGSKKKYPDGGKVGEKFYIDGKEYKITKRYEGFWDTAGSGSDEWVTFDKPIKLSNGDTIDELPLKDYLQMQKNGKLNVGYNTGYAFVDPSYYTSIDNLGWGNQAVSLPGQGNKYYTINYSATPQNSRQKLASATVDSTMPKIGDVYTVGNKKYKVTQNQLTDSDGAVVQVKQISDPDRNVGSYADTYAGYKVIPLATFKKDWMHQKPETSVNNQEKKDVDALGNPKTPANSNTGTKYTVPGVTMFEYTREGNQWKYRNKQTGATGVVTTPSSLQSLNEQIGIKPPAATQPANTNRQQPANTQQRPAAQPRPTGKPKTAQEALNYFARGGSVYNQYQVAGEVTGGPGTPPQTRPGTFNTTVATQQQAQAAGNQRIDPNKEIFVGDITLEDGTVVKAYYKGNQKYVKDASGNILASGTRTDTSFEQYGSTNINKILSSSPNVLYTTTNFGSFDNQPGFKQSGIYLSSGNQGARQSGDLSPEEWTDFQNRHGDWIDKQYTGGFAQFQKDLRTGRTTGDKAAGWFQDAVNEKSMAQAGVPYFAPLGKGKKEDNPYYRDSKFGQVTYSVPRFFDAPPPPEQPGDEMSYFCVEYTDGTKNVVSVSHKAGEAPVAPSGSNIKTVGSASKDKAVIDGQCISVPEITTEKTPKKEGPWWLQDIVNYVGAMTDEVNRYGPVQSKIDSVTPGYDLLDPTRKLAANQEQMARFQSQVENTADGNVGLATTLGASGEGFANAANVLAADEAANIGIVNQAYGQNAAIQNNEMMANENARQKYVEDMATLNQQYDNSLQQKKWKQIAAFNNGTTNWFRKKQMEQVLFPQVYTDPILGDVDFSGQGRQILEEDGTGMAPQTYSPSYAGNNQGLNTGVGSLDAWQRIYDESLPLMGEEAARARANRLEAAQINMQNRMVTGPTQRQQYNQMVQQGLTLPMPLREFGGTMYLPWAESE
jgi:hypothetical protein